MCGIVGYCGSQFGVELIEGMNAVQQHRGPDGSGTWRSDEHGVALGHRRLSIIDLSETGAQPMVHPETGVVITFNGEIYNYRELRRDLEARGEVFRGTSDTEVILRAYLTSGRDVLSQLNGIFAFAIWDPRSHSLLVARDGFGVKPLYYSCLDAGFLFASEIKSLLAYEGLPRELDHTALRSYLSFLWSPGERTPLVHVRKLDPGHAMLVEEGRVKEVWQFYELPYAKPKLDLSETDAVAAVTETLGKAVERQMVADVEVGAFLSGGLDSSALVALAKQKTEHPMRCFTIAMDDEEARKEGITQDLPYAERVAKHLGVELNVAAADPDMAARLPEMIWHLDEPQADFAALNVLMISQLARESGIKVLLSGAGGDDIFSGYRRHTALLAERYWGWLPRPGRHALAQIARGLPVGNAKLRKVRKVFQNADLDPDERIVSYFDWLGPGLESQLFAADLWQDALSRPAGEEMRQAISRLPASASRLDRMLYLDSRYFLTDHNLNYSDKMSMATGVEARVPFLDPDLVDLVVRLPDAYKHTGREGKSVLRKAMEGTLPHEIIHRPKTGFGVPLRYWLRNQLQEFVGDTLSPELVKRRGLFDPAGVEQLIRDDREGRVDASYNIFSMLCIEVWMQKFFDV